jgi:enamine deaminase RidA (YjgF/YER057c/UK114 family)
MLLTRHSVRVGGDLEYPRTLGGEVPRSLGWARRVAAGSVTAMTTTEPAREGAAVRRINPTSWSELLGFDQAQLRPGPARLLTVAAQGPVDETGSLLHEDDPAAHLALAFANLEAVLAAAGLGLSDVLRLTVHAVDVEAVLGAYDVVTERLALAGATPPLTLVGVARLALPGMVVQLEAVAGR